MTRVVVQRGITGSNSSHNRPAPNPASSSSPPQSSSTPGSASAVPSSSPHAAQPTCNSLPLHGEEESVQEVEEAELVNHQGGDSDSLTTEASSKAGTYSIALEGRADEREQKYGHGYFSEDASTSCSNVKDPSKEYDAHAVPGHAPGEEVAKGSPFTIEGGLEPGEARKSGEEARPLKCFPENDRNVDSSNELSGSSNDWKRDPLPHPSVDMHQLSHPLPHSSMTWPGTSVPHPSTSFQALSHSSNDIATVYDPDLARSIFSQGSAELVGCSYVPTSASPQPLSSLSSRRSSWVGPSGSSVSRGGLSRRGLRGCKPTRNSPNSSRPTSPRSYGEGDGYNSADEQTSWSSGSPAYENNGEREHQFEVEIRRAKSLEVRRMAEDGNCLFRAVADQVYGDAEMYDDTRQMCIDYMEKERDHFSQFVTESFTAYCKRKRRDKVYGNNLEIQAMAEMYNRPIHIYSYSTDPINIFHGSYETDLPPIRLSYHRGNHYNSLIDPRRPAIGAGLGFGSLRGTNVDREQVKAALKAQQDQQIEKALLAEGSFYSDLELTEQEIERMVIEESRAEFFEEEKYRHVPSWSEQTSTSAAAEPSSSGTTRSPKSEVRAMSLAATSTADTDSAGLSSNVRMLLSMGFSYLRVMEACSIFGDDVNNMLCYLLETEGSSGEGESMYRKKGKAAER